MSNLSIAEDTPPHRYRVAESKGMHLVPATSQTGVKSWQLDILAVVVGLVALIYFVAQGGAFALLGPGVIYLGILSIRKRAGQGKQLLRILTGAALCCLSATALLAPAHTNLWCIIGSVLGLLASTIYLAITLILMRKKYTLIRAIPKAP